MIHQPSFEFQKPWTHGRHLGNSSCALVMAGKEGMGDSTWFNNQSLNQPNINPKLSHPNFLWLVLARWWHHTFSNNYWYFFVKWNGVYWDVKWNWPPWNRAQARRELQILLRDCWYWSRQEDCMDPPCLCGDVSMNLVPISSCIVPWQQVQPTVLQRDLQQLCNQTFVVSFDLWRTLLSSSLSDMS